MVTILNREISQDKQYVNLSLSDGSEIAISVEWATQYIMDEHGNPTSVSLLHREIEQATVRAQARADAIAANLAAAQAIIASIGG